MAGAVFSEQRSEHKCPFIKCVNIGFEDSIGISPYSSFVKFIVEVRIAFRDKFAMDKDQFPGIDSEVCESWARFLL